MLSERVAASYSYASLIIYLAFAKEAEATDRHRRNEILSRTECDFILAPGVQEGKAI